MKRIFFSAIFYVIATVSSFAQSSQAIYNWFDAKVGIENIGLSNGIEYIEFEKGSNGFTKFLYPDNVSNGFVRYDGQTYYDVALKYDVYDDKVIVNIGENSGKKVFEIFAAKVDSFGIDDRKFIQRKTLVGKDEVNIDGFAELLVDTKNLRLFKKLHKSKSSKIKNREVLFEYKFITPDYYLLYENSLYEVKRKQDFIEIFPQFKTELKELKIDKERKKNNRDIEVITFTNKINSLLSN